MQHPMVTLLSAYRWAVRETDDTPALTRDFPAAAAALRALAPTYDQLCAAPAGPRRP